MFESSTAFSPSATLSEQLQTLAEMLATASTREQVCGLMLSTAVETLGAQAAAIFLLNGDALHLEVQQGESELFTRARHLSPTGQTLALQLARWGQPIFPGQAPTPAQADLPALPSALALLPLQLDEQPLGLLALDFGDIHDTPVAEQHFLRVLAAQGAVALGRAAGMQELEAQIARHTGPLEARASELEAQAQRLRDRQDALSAFVRFTEATGNINNEQSLVQEAAEVLRTLFGDCSLIYWRQVEQTRDWQVEFLTDDVTPLLAEYLRLGLPAQSSLFLQALRTREPDFVISAWPLQPSEILMRGGYAAAGFFPVVIEDEVQAILMLGLRDQVGWPEARRALFSAVGRSLGLALERAAHVRTLQIQREELESRSQALEHFALLARDLAFETDPYVLIRRAQEIIAPLLPAGSLVYYEPEGDLWRLKSQVGDLANPDLQAANEAGFPRWTTPNLTIPWDTREPYYQDQYVWEADPLAGIQNSLPTTAMLPLLVSGQPRGIFGVGLLKPLRWTPANRAVLETAVSNLTLTLERAEQAARIQEQNETLAGQAQVLEAFAAFSHDVGQLRDKAEVIRRAQTILLSFLPSGYVLYFEPTEAAWHLRVWAGDVPAGALTLAQAGRQHGEMGNLETPWRTRQAYYQDQYDPATDRYGERLRTYVQATASFPVAVGGTVTGVLVVALTGQQAGWTPVQRTVMETLVRNLGLVLEAVQSTEVLQHQKVQLEARTRALQGFSDLTRTLNLNAEPHALAQSALDGMRALLPDGFVTYYELEAGRWRLRALSGDLGSPELMAAVEAGLPYAETRNLVIPWETRLPYYQNSYELSTDNLADRMGHVLATACLPVLVEGDPVGVIGCGLFTNRHWTETDRTVLESIVRSLGTALEGARGVQALHERTLELQRSNTELERFAYIASHDLQEPLRSISSFTQLLASRYADRLDSRGLQYLDFVQRGSAQMKVLITDLLTFSRLSGEHPPRQRLQMGEPLAEALSRLSAAIRESGADVQAGPLPEVLGDAPQLAQLFQNLISNALKFQRPEVIPQVRITAVREGTWWHFQVQDNGIGLSEEHFDRIFVLFQRLHRREEYQGTGLGLSICQKIVEGHGGRIWVESQLGQGSSFHFTLPEADQVEKSRP